MPTFFTEFPYTKITDINLDWILNKLKELDERVTALEEENSGGDTP